MAQGKEWNKEKVVELIKPFFQLGYTVNRACELAEFPVSTFKTWIADDELLRLKVKSWQGMVGAKSRENVVKAIQSGDIEQSNFWLTHQKDERGEFSTRNELVTQEVEDLDLTEEEEEMTKKYDSK